jgi:transcriptional regulator with XRE-family HTH domain
MLAVMTPPIKRKPSDRKPTSQRLKELRKSLDPEPSQDDIAERVGEIQMWVSRRERGKPEPTVDDAIRIAEALGYAADFLIVDRKQGELLSRLGAASPPATAYALRVLDLFPELNETGVIALEGVVGALERQAGKATAG